MTVHTLKRTLALAALWAAMALTLAAADGRMAGQASLSSDREGTDVATAPTATDRPHVWSLTAAMADGATVSDSVKPRTGRHAADEEAIVLRPDSLEAPADTAALRHTADSLQAKMGKPKALVPVKQFVPDPKRALWLSLVLPGAGQIYNRKYWKLPIIYGGFLGCAYALMWNQQMYRDYSQAYLDIMDDDPKTNSFADMLPPGYDISGREDQFKNLFKRKKDFYRRYRDLSAFCFIGVYLLSVVDAYVDAQLSVFDISPDLSMSVEPAVMGAPTMMGTRRSTAYGVGCSLRF